MTKHDILEVFKDIDFMYNDSTRFDTLSHMIDELLEVQEEKKRQWLIQIAEKQTANAPTNNIQKQSYKGGVYDGLEMAFNIITEQT